VLKTWLVAILIALSISPPSRATAAPVLASHSCVGHIPFGRQGLTSGLTWRVTARHPVYSAFVGTQLGYNGRLPVRGTISSPAVLPSGETVQLLHLVTTVNVIGSPQTSHALLYSRGSHLIWLTIFFVPDLTRKLYTVACQF